MATVALALGAGACGDKSADTTTTTPASTSTAVPVTTTAAAAVTTAAPPQTTAITAKPVPAFGTACQLGSLPDCIDPDGDGKGVYLQGGAACMQALKSSPELCTDLDGDGKAGYPDSG
ncbi:MAG: hypothetical protein QOJ69_1821 [Actinomycetota bacterium]|nr:hypothetical protein [Actinomycetota bacterium]